MKQKIFYHPVTGRVLCSYGGTDEFMDAQAAPENSLYAYVESSEPATNDWVYVNGQLSYAPTVIEKTYVALRQEAYPSVGAQLDMLWHAMDDGQIPKVEPFYSDILAIKVKYPKP